MTGNERTMQKLATSFIIIIFIMNYVIILIYKQHFLILCLTKIYSIQITICKTHTKINLNQIRNSVAPKHLLFSTQTYVNSCSFYRSLSLYFCCDFCHLQECLTKKKLTLKLIIFLLSLTQPEKRTDRKVIKLNLQVIKHSTHKIVIFIVI
jgi:hypothetical protein